MSVYFLQLMISKHPPQPSSAQFVRLPLHENPAERGTASHTALPGGSRFIGCTSPLVLAKSQVVILIYFNTTVIIDTVDWSLL